MSHDEAMPYTTARSGRNNRSVVVAFSVVALFSVAPDDAQALTCAAPDDGHMNGVDLLVSCSLCDEADEPASAITGLDAQTNAPNSAVTFEVEEVERVTRVEGGVSIRYRVTEPPTEGRYVLQSGDAYVSLSVEPDRGPPAVPEVQLAGYEMGSSVRSAHFYISGVNGMLVADVGQADENPMQNLQPARQPVSAGEFVFFLGTDVCLTTFGAADFGLETQVRFGTLAPSGDFSGWTDWVEVRYPDEPGNYVVDDSGRVYVVDLETGEQTLISDGSELGEIEDEPLPDGEDEIGDDPSREDEAAETQDVARASDPEQGVPASGTDGTSGDAESTAEVLAGGDAPGDGGREPAKLDEGVVAQPINDSNQRSSGCSLSAGASLGRAGPLWLLLGLVGLRLGRWRRRPSLRGVRRR